MAEKIDLRLREQYKIELYPSDSIITAMYVGQTGKEHNFIYEDGEDMGIVTMDDHWIRERIENGKSILTYSPLSSSSVRKISSLEIQENSMLTKLLPGVI